jgi:hypothetical protein
MTVARVLFPAPSGAVTHAAGLERLILQVLVGRLLFPAPPGAVTRAFGGLRR